MKSLFYLYYIVFQICWIVYAIPEILLENYASIIDAFYVTTRSTFQPLQQMQEILNTQ